MNIRELAKKLAIDNKMIHAEKYDLYYRDYDNMVEVLGWVQDPLINASDFNGREMLIPNRWVTLGVLDANMGVNV
jgi:hypothetical protein